MAAIAIGDIHGNIAALDDVLDLIAPEVSAGDIVVYGHWGNTLVDADGWPRPRIRKRTIGIDSIKHGVLTAYRLPDGAVFQSRRHRAKGMEV
jgi:hypothetical protein